MASIMIDTTPLLRECVLAGIPYVLARHLCQLTDDEAERVWVWLDEAPHSARILVEIIAKSHPELEKELSGGTIETDKDVADDVFVLYNEDLSVNIPTVRQLQVRYAEVAKLNLSSAQQVELQLIRGRMQGASEGRRAYLYDDLNKLADTCDVAESELEQLRRLNR